MPSIFLSKIRRLMLDKLHWLRFATSLYRRCSKYLYTRPCTTLHSLVISLSSTLSSVVQFCLPFSLQDQTDQSSRHVCIVLQLTMNNSSANAGGSSRPDEPKLPNRSTIPGTAGGRASSTANPTSQRVGATLLLLPVG